MPTNERDLALVTTVLQLAKDHWFRTGTAIRPEEAPLVLADAERLLADANRTIEYTRTIDGEVLHPPIRS